MKKEERGVPSFPVAGKRLNAPRNLFTVGTRKNGDDMNTLLLSKQRKQVISTLAQHSVDAPDVGSLNQALRHVNRTGGYTVLRGEQIDAYIYMECGKLGVLVVDAGMNVNKAQILWVLSKRYAIDVRRILGAEVRALDDAVAQIERGHDATVHVGRLRLVLSVHGDRFRIEVEEPREGMTCNLQD